MTDSRKMATTEALQVFSGAEALSYRMMPLTIRNGNILHCAVESGRDYSEVIREVEVLFGYHVEMETVEPNELLALITRNYRTSGHASSGSISGGADIVECIVSEAYSMNSSDIHFEPSETSARVRFRIDGRLVERHIIRKDDYPGIVNRVKILSNLDISEKRLPQDGRIMFSRNGVRFDIRTSVMPTVFGEKMVLRLLVRDSRRLALDSLGFTEHQLADYKSAISRPYGMILISGPTGSGKSTTLYATLELLNRDDNNILTIEDPVEYTVAGVNQVQLKEEIGLTFPVALRSFLRQDPDMIMLGEIRDEDTAEMAVRSSLTGHLVLSTLHTNSAWGCVARMIDMGVHPYMLSETLAACVAQRLVRRLCPCCKKEDTSENRSVGIITGATRTYRRCGCEKCYYTGYSGRKAIYEVIRVDDEIADAVRHEASNIDELMKSRNIISLKDSATNMYLAGETSLEEILPIINS